MFAHLDRLHEDDEDAVIPTRVTLRARREADDLLSVPGLSMLLADNGCWATLTRTVQRHVDNLKNSEAAKLLHVNTQRAAHPSYDLEISVRVPQAVALVTPA